MSLPPDPLLREVEEDLRRERFENLWKKYGGAVIGAVVAIVLVVAGHQGWQAYQANAKEEAGERFVQASELAGTDGDDAAARAFEAIGGSAPDGYTLLSKLRAAALFAEAGDHAEATDIYADLEESADETLHRDLAVLLRGYALLNSGARTENDDQALIVMLEPLTAPGRPMRHSARELLAMAALARGDQPRAVGILEEIRADPSTPQTMLQRAEQFLAQMREG